MNYRVKKRWLFIGSGIVVALAAFLTFVCFLKVDDEGYREVLGRANPSLPLETERSYRASQTRKGVRKDFWYMKGDVRLEMTLKGEDSELAYEKEGERQEIVERLNGVRCMIQEELQDTEGGAPTQTIRYIEATTAKYHYKTETLFAEQAEMSLYTLPGHRLPESLEGQTPTMTGSAKTVEVSIVNKAMKFSADTFRGILF